MSDTEPADREGLVTDVSNQDALARLKRYRAAIYGAHCVLSDSVEDAIARACMSVADQEDEVVWQLADKRGGELQRLRASIDRVKALHQKAPSRAECAYDGRPWPCRTIAAVEGQP